MLQGLSIKDVVLIDRLDIAFEPGLSVLTGETGAGKSILLDSLGLALGARSDSSLIRSGTPQLNVSAEFSCPIDHPVLALLAEQGLEAEGGSLVLRRIVAVDGRSRAFVNDQPISVGLLRRIGDMLVEIHGQFESHSLLDPATHRSVLDAYGGFDLSLVRNSWSAWRAAATAARQAAETLAKARTEEDYLRHILDEMRALAPQEGEEASLAERRRTLMQGEKLAEGINAALAALSQQGGVESHLLAASRSLERVASMAGGRLEAVVAALDRAAVETAEALFQLAKVQSAIDLDPHSLDAVEERLFALRAMARKHQVAVDALPALLARLAGEFDALSQGGDALARLAAAETKARDAYRVAAAELSRRRKEAASRLDAALTAELPPLKLEKARFATRIDALDETEWGETGFDRVSFEIATNPGMPMGPLAKIASGGELSRFMLALKVVLAGIGPAGTIVFDEVDSGIGGAVAAAVGERLGRLAGLLQVLVVTHSPQVAARGRHHWHVAKDEDGRGGTVARITPLSPEQRREEIARMLAGAIVTEQARAAAESLLAAS